MLSYVALSFVLGIGDYSAIESKTFSSAKYGFTLEYPSSWVTEPIWHCIHDFKGRTKDDLDRSLMAVINLVPEESRKSVGLNPVVWVWYQAIRSEAERVADAALPTTFQHADQPNASKFQTAQGLDGYKYWYLAEPGGPSPVSTVDYWLPHNGRLLRLMGMDGGSGLENLEPTFDAIAQSVRLQDPFSELPTNQPKTFTKGCATISYPGDWTRVVRSASDDDDGLRFEAPYAEKKETGTIQLLFDSRSLEQYTQESRESLSKNSLWLDITPFTNSKGQEGVRVAADIGIGKSNRVTWFVLPCSGGRLAVLFCWDHDKDDIDWNAAFEKIAKSFVVE